MTLEHPERSKSEACMNPGIGANLGSRLLDLAVGRRRLKNLVVLSLGLGDERFDGDKARHSSLR